MWDPSYTVVAVSSRIEMLYSRTWGFKALVLAQCYKFMMDLRFNRNKWVGNIYQKFEAVCHEVDDIVCQVLFHCFSTFSFVCLPSSSLPYFVTCILNLKNRRLYFYPIINALLSMGWFKELPSSGSQRT